MSGRRLGGVQPERPPELRPEELLASTMLDLLRRFEKELHLMTERLALVLYAAQQASNPVVAAAVADYEQRVAEGRPPEGRPAAEVIAEARALSEELRRRAAES